jgi:hypothetical protein
MSKVEVGINKTIKSIILEHYGKIPRRLEMSQINSNSDNILSGDKKIIIFSNDNFPMIPHFHYFDTDTFHLEVQIENCIKQQIILNSKIKTNLHRNTELTWDNLKLSKEKKELIKWLKAKNYRQSKITNYEAVRLSWEINNPDSELMSDMEYETIMDHYGRIPLLVDKALMNNKTDKISAGNKKIYVCGKYKNNTIPHFHYLDKDTFHLKIRIKDCEKELVILENSAKSDWKNLKKQKKELEEWLHLTYPDTPEIKNYKMLSFFWNINNRGNGLK